MSRQPGFAMRAVKKGGKRIMDRDRFERLWARLADGVYDFIVERHVATRSLKQNRAYWPCIVAPCSESSGYHPDEVHEILKRFCNAKTVTVLNKATGEMEEVTIGGSTTTLDVEQFSLYFKRCQQFAAETWDCYCPDPNEEYAFEKPRQFKKAS